MKRPNLDKTVRVMDRLRPALRPSLFRWVTADIVVLGYGLVCYRCNVGTMFEGLDFEGVEIRECVMRLGFVNRKSTTIKMADRMACN